MGKFNPIQVAGAKVDNGEAPLNIMVSNSGLSLNPGDTVSIAKGQQCYLRTADINGTAVTYRTLPFRLNDEVIEDGMSVNTIANSRYVISDKVESLGDGLYRMTWKDFFAMAKPRFRTLAKVVKVISQEKGGKTLKFIEITDDAVATLSNVGDVYIQDVNATNADSNSERIVNSQGKEVRKYVILKKQNDYIAQE